MINSPETNPLIVSYKFSIACKLFPTLAAMKIRIRENTLRIRITQSELKDLSKGEFLSSTTRFPGGGEMSFGIIPSEDETTQVVMMDQRISIHIGLLDHQTMMDESTIGVQSMHKTSERPLELLIEKDFTCLHPRSGEDADTFPNPN